jgi:hypothetical protein
VEQRVWCFEDVLEAAIDLVQRAPGLLDVAVHHGPQVSARFTVAISSASPAIFSSLGWSIGILRADRASARTECPASRAAFTVSRPIPLLAPIIRTVATASMLPVGPARSRHLQCRQPHRKMGGRLERVSKASRLHAVRAFLA